MSRDSRQKKTTTSAAERQKTSQTTIDPAKHHVGRTLESDPEYNEHPARERAPEAGLIDQHGNDLTASPDLRDTMQRMRDDGSAAPEPLKTRLPGDTTSDPHTDLASANATMVHRGEEPARKSKRR